MTWTQASRGEAPFLGENAVLGLLLLIKALTVAAPLGLIFFVLCEGDDSEEAARYWEAKVAQWERERERELQLEGAA